MENSNKQNNKDPRFLPEIRRGHYGVLNLYEVSESELIALAQGSPCSIYLNFSIFLLSVSFSFFIALITTTITSNRAFTVFVVITVISAIGGIIFLILWIRTRKSISNLIQSIKRRLPPEGTQVEKTSEDDSKTDVN
jgi:hypothetical protein